MVADVRSPWLMAPLDHKLDELDDELDEALPSVELAARALDLAPGLLGRDGLQRYLLQFATPGESRAAGGYVGSYGVLVAVRGQLALDLTGSTEDVNVPLDQPPRPFDPPPGWDELYSTFHVGRFPGNVTADPSWPTDSDVARQIYGQVPGVGDVAGTLYADPTAMAAILQLTGAVYVPSLGLTLDASNVEHYLLIDQYVAFEDDNEGRRAVLGDVTHAVFDALTTRKLGGLRGMIDALGKAVDGGHLKLSVFDPEGEELLDELGLSGAWAPTPGADYLSLRSTDLLSNKMDTFIQRSMAVDVTHDPTTGAVRSTVTITMTNTAPSGGLPWYIIGNDEDLAGGTGRDDVALYSPQGLDGATLDGQPIGMLKNRYADGSVYSFPVQIVSGQTRTLSVTLERICPRRTALLARPPASAAVRPRPGHRHGRYAIRCTRPIDGVHRSPDPAGAGRRGRLSAWVERPFSVGRDRNLSGYHRLSRSVVAYSSRIPRDRSTGLWSEPRKRDDEEHHPHGGCHGSVHGRRCRHGRRGHGRERAVCPPGLHRDGRRRRHRRQLRQPRDRRDRSRRASIPPTSRPPPRSSRRAPCPTPATTPASRWPRPGVALLAAGGGLLLVVKRRQAANHS